MCTALGLGVYDTAAAQPGPSSDPDAPHDRRFQLVATGLIGHPLGEFADNVDTSWGGGFDFVYRLGDAPVWLGAGVGVLRYDRATHEVPFSLTVPDVLVEVTTSNNLVMPYGLVRFQSSDGTVRPYVEGRVGSTTCSRRHLSRGAIPHSTSRARPTSAMLHRALERAPVWRWRS